MGLQKGTDKIWEALLLCKTDFEVIQIEWYDKRTPQEIELAKNWIKNKPPQVTFVPIMKREDVGRYCVFALFWAVTMISSITGFESAASMGEE